MADGGQGFFKICFSILPENYLESELDSSSDDDDVPKKSEESYILRVVASVTRLSRLV